MRPEEVTVAEALKAKGYATGHFGKWHLGTLHSGSGTSPGAQGFDEWVSSPNFYENNPMFSHRGKVVRKEGEGSDVTVDAALEFMEASARGKKPFVAVIWFGSPHNPHQAPDALKQPYAGHPPEMQDYWGEITGIDRAVGKLRRRMRELELADNTLLWYTSDNGAAKPGSTGGLRGMKSSNWEGGLRVPGLMEWPGRIKSARVIRTPCGSVDILPTVLAAAGVEYPEKSRELDGQSLLPLLEDGVLEREKPLGFWTYPLPGKPTPGRDLLLAQEKADSSGVGRPPLTEDERKSFAARYPEAAFPGHAAWLDGRFKLHALKGENYELYDLEADPKETSNLAASETPRVEKMKAELRTWQQSVLRSLNGGDYGPR
jgi:arylsulfatase A-like enzyme